MKLWPGFRGNRRGQNTSQISEFVAHIRSPQSLRPPPPSPFKKKKKSCDGKSKLFPSCGSVEHCDSRNISVAERNNTLRHHGGGGGIHMKMAQVNKQRAETSFTGHPLSSAIRHRLFLIKEQIYRWDDIVHLIWRESLNVRRGDDKCILYCWAYLTDYVITLPGVEILRPGLQNVRETDGEISKGDYAVGPDHRKSRALQHRKHEPDVFFTHRWADENSQY